MALESKRFFEPLPILEAHPFIELQDFLDLIKKTLIEKNVSKQLPHTSAALCNPESEPALIGIWQSAYKAGAASRLDYKTLVAAHIHVPKKGGHAEILQAIQAILIYHSDAAIDTPSFYNIAALALRSDEKSEFYDYFQRRITTLCSANVPSQLLPLLLIEMAAYTKLHAAISGLKKLLDPTISISYAIPKGDETISRSIADIYFAFGVYDDANRYLQQVASNYFPSNEILTHPLYAWMGILHARDNDDRMHKIDAAKKTCYELLGVPWYLKSLAAMRALLAQYPKNFSGKYLEKAKGITT